MTRLFVDENLVGLARRLRLFGIDARTPRAGLDDDEVARAAGEDGRRLVTRDRELAGCVGHVILVTTDAGDQQVREVLRATGVPDRARWFTRCSLCNVPLRALEPSERATARGLPDHRRDGAAWTCPVCLRVYWKGSHYARAVEQLRSVARALGVSTSSRPPADARPPGTEDR